MGRESAPRNPSAGAPAGRTRTIPQRVKDAVWRRDAGRCAFTGEDGRRCGSQEAREYDHVVPWALGGASQDQANIRLLCRAHNDLEARLVFGDAAVEAAIVRPRP